MNSLGESGFPVTIEQWIEASEQLALSVEALTVHYPLFTAFGRIDAD